MNLWIHASCLWRVVFFMTLHIFRIQIIHKKWSDMNWTLTHCGPVTPYGDIGQHWLRQWLVAWWHQAITWTNIDHESVLWLSHESNFLCNRCSEITLLKLLPHLQGSNELKQLKSAKLSFTWAWDLIQGLVNPYWGWLKLVLGLWFSKSSEIDLGWGVLKLRSLISP